MNSVWLGIDCYPESTTVLVAETKEGILKAIVRTIGRSEFEAFARSLSGVEATGVTFDDPPDEVLTIWSGAPQSTEDGEMWGDDWLVRQQEVSHE